MRVLIITQVFPPEMGALSSRMYPIVRELVSSGHEVFVATGMPSYPRGVVFPEYRGKIFLREKMDGFTVLRTASYTAPRNKSKWSQMLDYLSFIPAAFHSGLRVGKVDVVLATSPPIFTAIPAILLAKMRNAKFVFDLRDLWPDELFTYGGMRENSLPVRVIRWIERWAYKQADLITATTSAMVDAVTERMGTREKMFFLPNGADLELFRPLPRNNPIAREYAFGDRFVIAYSGLFGIKHGLDVLLEAAELLRDYKDIVFLLIGNGACRDSLIQQAQDKNLTNVIFGSERSVKEIPLLLARIDAGYAAVRQEPYAKKVISVKLFEYMACEKPVIGSLSGESARVVEESGGGLVVSPGNAQALAQAIVALYSDPVLREEMGRRGRRNVEEHYSRSVWASRLEKRMRELIEIAPLQSTESTALDV